MNTPELDKISKLHEKSQAIGEFLEWLESDGIYPCRYEKTEGECEEGYYPITDGINKLLAKFFEIDEKKAEDERRAILQDLRDKQNNKVELK